MDAYTEAIKILSRKRRSAFELKQKLVLKEFSSEEICEALEKCKEKGFLNDAEYVQDFVSFFSKRGVSARALYLKLKRKFNLSEEELYPYINDAEDLFKEGIESLLNKTKNKKLLETKEGRRKLIQMLLRKGFSLDTIKRSGL